MIGLRRCRETRWVHPSTHEIVKFLPRNPPEKGDVCLVDGERCRVLRSKVRWEGLNWTIEAPGVKVKPDPLPEQQRKAA